MSRRIKVMADDVECQLVRLLQQTSFVLQLDGNDFLGVNATAEATLRRENLVPKRLHPALDEAMRVFDQVVNHIKGKPKCNRIFQQLCADEGKICVNLLHFTQIRWLLRGKLQRKKRLANLYDSMRIHKGIPTVCVSSKCGHENSDFLHGRHI